MINQSTTLDLLAALRLIGASSANLASAAGQWQPALAQIDRAFPLLAAGLRGYAAQAAQSHVYSQPEAFTAFIEGGGNIGLYAAVSAALAEDYRRHALESLLDIGCGNGHALVPALQLAGAAQLRQIGLLEPAQGLLDAAQPQVVRAAPEAAVHAWALDLQQFLQAEPYPASWQLAQSSFCLQAIAPVRRWALLERLRERIDRLCIIEFDVPDLAHGSDAWLLSLAQRYERALGEYTHTRELVASGFLMPMLLGQLAGNTVNSNWEHPAAHWQLMLQKIGYRKVSVRWLHDYFWSPAFVLQAQA